METREENPLWMSESSEEARDQVLMKKVKEIANQIDPSIQVTLTVALITMTRRLLS